MKIHTKPSRGLWEEGLETFLRYTRKHIPLELQWCFYLLRPHCQRSVETGPDWRGKHVLELARSENATVGIQCCRLLPPYPFLSRAEVVLTYHPSPTNLVGLVSLMTVGDSDGLSVAEFGQHHWLYFLLNKQLKQYSFVQCWSWWNSGSQLGFVGSTVRQTMSVQMTLLPL